MSFGPEYSVLLESKKLLVAGIINNKLHGSAPPEIKDAAHAIEYTGTPSPTIPVNWRFSESISAIKGFQGAMLNVLLRRKYGVPYQKIIIDTDHAQLFIMSFLLHIIDPLNLKIPQNHPAYQNYFPNCDVNQSFSTTSTPLDFACSNIYRTKDDRFFHLHGSMNPRISQEALGISIHVEKPADMPSANAVYQKIVSQHNSQEIESLMNDKYRQAGTICWSTEEYSSSEHGKANAHVGLYEVHHILNNKQSPTWWTPVEGKTDPSRPLFGLKVLDLTRIIAAPAIARELAELGASVLRITSPNLPDMSYVNLDLGWGKWNAYLDLTKEEDRSKLRSLIEESDVVVDGYRPGVMEKWGFGKADILNLFANKDRGIIYARSNCYGWNGPWSYRSGWQQISDANCGISLGFGRAIGVNEPVTPLLPNSDFCTGAAGATGILQALIERAEKGGSYVVDVALNYYSKWLATKCSVYPPEVWDVLWANYNRPVLRHTDGMAVTMNRFVDMYKQKGMIKPEFFEDRENKALGVPVRTLKPILTFPDGKVIPGYNIGSRANGIDKPRWPEDLLTEVIS